MSVKEGKELPKILALGTCCVDLYPQKSTITPGGEALNIAAQLSNRDDVDVWLMGVIGNDRYGEVILESIKHRNINRDHLYEMNGETAHHVIQIDKTGDRFFEEGAWHGGVSEKLTLGEHEIALLSEVDAVLTTLWQPNLEQLVELKRGRRYLLAVDFNDRRDFASWEHLVAGIDVFFSSGTKSMEEDFHQRSQNGNTIFVLTYGEHGSTAFHKGEAFECDADPVNNVLDTTGCGDCYQANFVLEYLLSGDISTSMRRGASEAAKVTQYVGGFQS